MSNPSGRGTNGHGDTSKGMPEPVAFLIGASFLASLWAMWRELMLMAVRDEMEEDENE